MKELIRGFVARSMNAPANEVKTKDRRSICCIAVGALACVVALLSQAVMADEGGVSFWIPGTFGSLAAVPQQPGWSLPTINYHDNVSGGADVVLAREYEIGKVPVNFSGSQSGAIKLPNFDIQVFVPSYVFATPVLGGQAAVSILSRRWPIPLP